METSLQSAGAMAAEAARPPAGANPVTVYLARLTSAESRRAMATSLELLAELLVDGQPAEQGAQAAVRMTDGRGLRSGHGVVAAHEDIAIEDPRESAARHSANPEP